MPCKFPVRLPPLDKDPNHGWIPALIAMATEIQALNGFVGTLGINPETGEDFFPRAISCNPSAMELTDDGSAYVGTIENFVGDGNSIPSEDGMMMVNLNNYDYIEWDYLPAKPTTFRLISGIPPQSGRFA